MSRGAKVVLRIGLALFALGLLLVSFVAYQLWGTALYEQQAQSTLRSELSHQLHRALPTSAAALTASQRLGLPTVAKTPAPFEPDPAIDQAVGLLSIPKIGVLDAIVEGVGEGQLEQGPGHYPGTSLPGEPGNAAIAGHRTTYAHPFYNLDALGPGDNIYILTAQGLFKYTVMGSQVVAPTDVAVLYPVQGRSTLTLTTCNPRYSAATRLVVKANLDAGPSVDPVSAFPTVPRTTQLAGESNSASLGGGGASWLPVILWGMLTVAIVLIAWFIARSARLRLVRALAIVVSIPLLLGSLFMLFAHVSLALPGSF